MRCTRCDGKAVIVIRGSLKLCADHFNEYVLNTVEKTIRRFRMFDKKSRILVAVSGGKDSLAVWDILKKLGYDVGALYINLNIPEYSEKSREYIRKYSEDFYELSIPQDLKSTARKHKRKICSVCGVFKRYLMNKFAVEHGYDVVVTGHNLDDECAFLLHNILHWNIDYLSKQDPFLPRQDTLIAKAKPLVFLTEKETSTYCLINNIDYLKDECPYSTGAVTNQLKTYLNDLERRSPGTKLYFYKQFLKIKHVFPERKDELHSCKICGYPCSGEICAFCRLTNGPDGI